MELLRDVDELPQGLRFVFTLGIFDGVHRGHQRVLDQTVRAARRLEAQPVVVTFEPHPAAVLRGAAPAQLCHPAERLGRLAQAGIAMTVLQRFDEQFAAQSAEQFLHRLAAGRHLAAMLMTAESTFGHDREGNLAEVKRLAGPLGFEVLEVDRFELAGAPVSSSRVRQLLAAGRLAVVRQLLGRDYAVVGKVVHGDGRGRELGYPTANFGFSSEPALPPDGIYAVRLSWAGESLLQPARRAAGVASLGVRPTFGVGRRVLEAYLFDIDEDLYGEQLRLEFVRWQRGEKRFSSIQQLIEQMDRDAARARRILRRGAPGGRESERLC